jgi:signal transduction histidine kinase
VNDLLALARSDSGPVRPVLAVLNLGEVVRDEVLLLKVLAEEKSQDLSLDIAQSAPVRIDRSIFRQAVANILHNAIQYTPEGKAIRIRVGKDGEGCYVDFADAGPGIGPEHQQRVFDRFYRVDQVRSRQNGGAGLGLAIARRAVEIHDGRIELHSEPGAGSTFRIRLPEAQPPKESLSSFGNGRALT